MSLYDRFLAETTGQQDDPPSLYEKFLAEQAAPGPTRAAAAQLDRTIDPSQFGVEILGEERPPERARPSIAGLPLPTPPARDTDPSPVAPPPVRAAGLPSAVRDLPLSALNRLLQPEEAPPTAEPPASPQARMAAPSEPLGEPRGVSGSWEEPGQFMQGVRTGFESGRSGLGETLETVGGLTGAEGIEARGEAMSEAARGRQEGYAGRVTDVREIKSLDDFKDWAAFALGQGLGSTAAPIAGGAVGAAATGGSPVGAMAGALAPSYALILGEIRGEMEQAGVDPATVDKVAPLAAVPASALEALLPGAIGRKAVSGTAAKFGKELAGRLLRRGAQGTVIEGATEAGQDAIAKGATAATSEEEFLTPETAWSLVNSALAGALPGAAFGVAGGVTEGRFGRATPEGDGAPGRLPGARDPMQEPTFMRRGGRAEIERVGDDHTRVSLAPPSPQEVAEARERSTDTGTQAVDVMPTEQEQVAPETREEESEPERPVRAAVRLPDGTVLLGETHAEALEPLVAEDPPNLQELLTEGEQLFETSSGRLVDRAEAARLVGLEVHPVVAARGGGLHARLLDDPEALARDIEESRRIGDRERASVDAQEPTETVTPEAEPVLRSTTAEPGAVESGGAPTEVGRLNASRRELVRALEQVGPDTPRARTLQSQIDRIDDRIAREADRGTPESTTARPDELEVQEFDGEVGNDRHITRKETGRISTRNIADLEGVSGEVRGEHRNRQGEEWETFKADIEEHGIQDPIFITVEPDGTARISEGNHRLDAAIELGLEDVPVEVRYFGKGERHGSLAERAATESTTAEPEALSQEGGGPEVAVPEVGEAAQMPTGEIRVDPERFQFKDNTDEQGVTRTLKSVKKWDPNSAGVILVWRDPADGETYVVNGHHRLELANRLGVPNVLARHIEAADASEARVQGALANIREGRGTSVDAAKLFREEGITPADLEEYGVSLTEAVARDGLALANLHPTIFRDVSTGRLREQRAAVIGSSGLEQEQQLAVYQALQQREKRGRRPTNDEVAELIRNARQAGTTEVTQETLFGEETLTKSNLFEWAEVSSYIKNKLAKTKRRFGPMSKDDVAEDVERQGVGEIDPARAEAIATQAGRLGELYDRLSTKSGPVAKALNSAAARIARGEDRNEVKQKAYTEVQDALEREIAGAQGADPSGTEAAAGRREAGPEAAEAEGVAGEPTARVKMTPAQLSAAIETRMDGGEHVDGLEVEDGQLVVKRGTASIIAEISNAMDEEAQQSSDPSMARLARGAATALSNLHMKVLEAEESLPAPQQPAGDALELQGNLLGGDEAVGGSEQRSLIGEDPETLDRQERVARQTVDRLRPIMEGGTPTEEQRAQYRDALALIRRNEGQSAEETSLRAEGDPVTEEEQGGELFGGPMGDIPAGATVPQASREAQGPQTEEAIAPPKKPRRTVTVGSRTLHPIAPVELARIAEELLGGEGTGRIFTKKYPSARGMFYPDPTLPRIGLNPKLGQDYDQFARTLAHEVGHLIDFLPDQDMNRGNILGRLATLKSHLSTTIDSTPSDPSQALTPEDRKDVRKRAMRKVGPRPPKDSEADLAAWREEVSRLYAEMIQDEIADRGLLTREAVHEELIALSEFWRPYDRASASESFIKYRESSPELYADAMSALLNDPAALQELAPTFLDAWMAYSGRKPDVKRAYEAIQSLIGEPGAVMAARKEEIERDFERGEAIQRESEEQGHKQGVINYLRQAFLERGAPLTDAEKERVGSVPAHSESRAVRMALQEHQHADNVNRVMLTDLTEEVHTPMVEAGIEPEQAGRYLMLQRIADGDRGGMAEQAKEAIQELTGFDTWERAKEAYIARQETEEEFDADLLSLAESGVLNPHGYTPEEAARTLDALREEMGDDQFQRLGEIMQRFRDILFNPVETAVALGTYNAETFETRILPNRDTYAPFAVLDYFNGRMPAGVKRQMGTVRGIANPYTTAMLKAMSLNRLNEYQRVKLQILKVLDTDFPGMAGEEQAIDKYHRESNPGKGRANFLYMRDGKLFYREVDEYIAKVLDQADLGFVGRMSKGLSNKAYGLFHPLYVTWSLGWQVRNVQRDFKRTYKNLSSARSDQPTYKQALGAVYDLFKLNAAYARTAGAAWKHAKGRSDPLIREMLSTRALGRAFHSFEPNIEDAKYERLLQQYGLQEPRGKGWKQIARSIGHLIEEIGVFQETWSKAATYDLLDKVEGLSPRERSYIVRNYAGTPDSTQRGLVSEGVNGVLLYANVIMAGWRADAEVALQPQTASGYWFRSFLIDFMPKAAMAAAVFGLFGDDMEEWMDRVPSYDKEKYLVVPIPPFWSENERGEKKAVYLRVPHDDVNRVMAGAVWAAFMTQAPHQVSRTLGLVSGEFGGLNPALSLPYAWYQVTTGKNPDDRFRGRKVIPQTEWEAGGWSRWKELIRYTAGQFGIASDLAGYFTNEYPDDSRSTLAEKVVRSIPGVSSLIKVSDRGLTEERWWEIDRERQARAKLRAELPTSVKRNTSERARLNRFGEERLTDIEKERREQLNAWYRNVYMPMLDAMEQARDTDDEGGFRRALAEVERLTDAFNEDPTQVPTAARRRTRPERPKKPSRPSR